LPTYGSASKLFTNWEVEMAVVDPAAAAGATRTGANINAQSTTNARTLDLQTGAPVFMVSSKPAAVRATSYRGL
jgi:hypothetical protein